MNGQPLTCGQYAFIIAPSFICYPHTLHPSGYSGYGFEYPDNPDDMEEDGQSEREEMEDFLGTILNKLSHFGDKDQIRVWRSQLFQSVDYHNQESVEEWYEDLERQHSQRITGQRNCVRELPSILVPEHESDFLPQQGGVQATASSLCTRWVTVLQANTDWTLRSRQLMWGSWL